MIRKIWQRRGAVRRAARLAGPLAAAMAVALTWAAGPALATDAPLPGSVVPDRDPFYAAPADIASYSPGQVVATRPFTPKGLANVSGWHISYRTNDSHGTAELAVTTLVVPRAAWTGAGPRPVLSSETAEDATGTQCTASYGLASGQEPAASGARVIIQEPLKRGWAVAVPDFEGPKSAFIAGYQAGHAVLDGIRAVKNARLGGIGLANQWALDGYSGGASAAGWAAQLQPSYAPDVRLVGAAIGGLPADPAAVARAVDGGLFSGFELAVAASFHAEYPEAGIDRVSTPRGAAVLAQARGKCVTDLLLSFPFQKLSSYSTVPEPLAVPSIAAVLRANTLGASAPTTPILNYHANTDEIVPVAQADTLVHAWCTRGAKVQSIRDALGEHALEFLVRQNDKLTYLSDRFAGKAAEDTCESG